LPEIIVSDNGPQFTSEEFKRFCQIRGIVHVLTSPYHPQSNGEAERFVQTFKYAMKKMIINNKNVDSNLNDFLLLYQVTPHPTTGVAPCELFMKRRLKT